MVRAAVGTSITEPDEIFGANLFAWYRADLGITLTSSHVSQWDDQSGNARHLTQGTDANRPQSVSTLLGQSAIVMHASATPSYMNFPGSLAVPTTGTIWVVCSRSTAGINDLVLSSTFSTRIHTAGGQFQMRPYGDPTSTSTNDTNGHLIRFSWVNAAGTVVFQKDNGSEEAGGNTVAGSLGNLTTLGTTGTSRDWDGLIAEIIFVNTAVTAQNVTDVQTYINSRYAIW